MALGSGPSPRFGHVSAMALNRFWVFGGRFFDFEVFFGASFLRKCLAGNDFRVEGLNDLWYFTPDAHGSADLCGFRASVGSIQGFGEFKFRLWALTGLSLGLGPKVGWTSLPASGTWPSARQAGAAEADSSGRFWIFGGRTKQRRCLLKSCSLASARGAGENAPFNAPFMRNDLWHFTVEVERRHTSPISTAGFSRRQIGLWWMLAPASHPPCEPVALPPWMQSDASGSSEAAVTLPTCFELEHLAKKRS